ncbi:MAG: hypothetical protein FWH22_05015 [Fibromonadales bacterium]|nr:hypothetical protein [Fibromonadales bacterium]
MKKVLLTILCAALLMSCSSKRAAFVDFAITEAQALQALAKAQGIEVSAEADSLITAAKKQNDERQTEAAYVLADKAILQLQISLLKHEQSAIATDNKNATIDLNASKESLDIYRNVLKERRNAPKEQVIN